MNNCCSVPADEQPNTTSEQLTKGQATTIMDGWTKAAELCILSASGFAYFPLYSWKLQLSSCRSAPLEKIRTDSSMSHVSVHWGVC